MSTKLENAPKIKTQVVAYKFDITTDEGLRSWEQLLASQKEIGIPLVEFLYTDTYRRARGEKVHTVVSGDVVLETDHAFEDQWNTADDSPTNPSFRLHDFVRYIYPNRDLRGGHYVVMTDEIRNFRKNTVKCRYCGNLEPLSKEKFHMNCLGSEYMTEGRLPLIRYKTLADTTAVGPLTKSEHAYLLPLFKAAQLESADSAAGRKLRKHRASLIANHAKTVENSEIEMTGMLWIMDQGLSTENCIYYSHTKVFTFGWRNPVSKEERKAIDTAMQGFKFNYEVKER